MQPCVGNDGRFFYSHLSNELIFEGFYIKFASSRHYLLRRLVQLIKNWIGLMSF